MYTTITLLLFIAFFLLYNTSKKSRWADKSEWASYFEKRKMLSSALSAILVLLAGIALVYTDGSVAGLFSLVVAIMAMASLIVLLFPFRYLSIKHIALFFLLFVVFEQLIF